uniref:Uncharacterized protein n=1 Tax=Rhizophora mucronata TaxID=61149 RepID=A0A2P2P886_RHIMU
MKITSSIRTKSGQKKHKLALIMNSTFLL